MLSIWGDVPYTGASTIWKTSNYADAKAKDVFDSDVETYKTILKDLKEVGDYFAAGNLNRHWFGIIEAPKTSQLLMEKQTFGNAM